jgi:hypothetical protein
VNGEVECFTLEDVVRPVKIKHETAIPEGTYKVDITWSNRFQKPMPLVFDVPGFTGIRIHTGNTKANTSGCILVGERRVLDRIDHSQEAFSRLFNMMKDALEMDEEITLEITHAT